MICAATLLRINLTISFAKLLNVQALIFLAAFMVVLLCTVNYLSSRADPSVDE